MDDIRLIAADLSPNIISVNETWLHHNINDELVSIPNYRIFRHDRASKSGGGVAVWVSNSIQCYSVDLSIIPCEINCVLLTLPICKLIFVSLYINPQTAVNNAV